jgi:ArsR family transcriptional regulator
MAACSSGGLPAAANSWFNTSTKVEVTTMRKNVAVTVFESLSSGIRLDAYRLLVREGKDGMVAGEIAAALDVPPTNLSFHLKAMTQAGLVTVEQQGRFQRYRANFPLIRELIGYLTDECCAGHPEQCADLGALPRRSARALVPIPPIRSRR